ncbi:MAG: hypothetical protein H0T60_08025 [Acidobacteria bacterium]|nr:hypothetical protein [Acidobacteriota bacterium]
MEVSLSQLVDARPALARLMSQPAPAPLAFSLTRVAKAVEAELDTYDETRLKLCRCHGMLVKEETHFEFTPENRAAFDVEYQALVQTSLNLPVNGLKLDALGGLQISAADLMRLSWLITE